MNYPKSECRKVSDEKKKPEAVLERKLVRLWQKEHSITDEQLPVGLFTNEVAVRYTLTPRGASQIDLWQLINNTMRIYELKVEGNESVGIISELFFYVCTIKHIVDGVFNYPNIIKAKDFRHFKAFANAVNAGEIIKVTGIFTAHCFHPLIEKLYSPILDILKSNSFGIDFEYMRIPNHTI